MDRSERAESIGDRIISSWSDPRGVSVLSSDRIIAAAQVLLSAVFIGCYFAMLAAFMAGYVRVPENYKDAFTALLGVLTAGVGQILAFWYARTRPST